MHTAVQLALEMLLHGLSRAVRSPLAVLVALLLRVVAIVLSAIFDAVQHLGIDLFLASLLSHHYSVVPVENVVLTTILKDNYWLGRVDVLQIVGVDVLLRGDENID